MSITNTLIHSSTHPLLHSNGEFNLSGVHSHSMLYGKSDNWPSDNDRIIWLDAIACYGIKQLCEVSSVACCAVAAEWRGRTSSRRAAIDA